MTQSIVVFFQLLQTGIEKVLAPMTAFLNMVLGPVFRPLNVMLGNLPNWVASVFGIGLFVLAMVWVGVFLNSEYVNSGRPNKSIWTDLRIWTCLSMLPHVAVYLYFR